MDHEHQPLAREPAMISDDAIQEMLLLATRLREQSGGELDDSAILAVSEATGAPVDYVRLAVQALPHEKKRQTILERIRTSFLTFDPSIRRYVMAAFTGTFIGFSLALSDVTRDSSGLLSLLGLVGSFAALWNAAVARDSRIGAASGALAGAASFLTFSFFLFCFNLIPGIHLNGLPPLLILMTSTMGAALGAIANLLFQGNRRKLGLKDPAAERHALLNQLLEIQDRLRSDEQFAAFLSVDIVGSTRLKSESDPLSVEFTFNEYHLYVETVCRKHGGRVHSTAGDGVTCYFDRPDNAFAAGKALLSGLFEFNAFRNRLGKDLELRAGLHSGSVLAPGRDLGSVNFAHVIDIASHLQKLAPSGCLAMSDQIAAYLPGGQTAVGSEKVESHDIRGVVWRPSAKVNSELVRVPPT